MSRSLVLAGVAAAILAAGAFWATRPTTPPAFSLAAEAQEATAEQIAMVPDMALGAADAPVTVIEYASFTCPHCATFHKDVWPRLKADYIDTGKVRFIHREVYFDRYGLWAAMIARCGGGTERYFGIADMIYDGQKDWIGDGQANTVAGNLRRLGLAAGIGEDALESCLNDAEMAQAMVATYQKHATEHGVNSTPTLVIDGESHSNMSYNQLRDLLDARLGN
ncbi:MAG: DsbA family protein [Rhodobacteraceae bacterium]|nr:DsbA family protein [Paracoccaceae bacterium]